jgi:kumamolisin
VSGYTTGIVRPPWRPGPRAADAPKSLTAVQVARAYAFPDADGDGQTIAIIELGGGFGKADLDDYFGALGLSTPDVQAVSVDGARNEPGQDPNGADGEVLLDIEVAGAVAPGAAQRVYFAPNTDAGFLHAIQAAMDATPTPVAISISWGGPEDAWSSEALSEFNAVFAQARAKGILVFAAAGDSGATDGTRKPTADYPASDPWVIACGGTRLELDDNGSWGAESVWDDGASSASGGGYSATFPRPAWQPASIGEFRGLPDISANADPETGYIVVIDGERAVVGGTSAVAPLLAGLAARLAQLRGTPVGDLLPVAYANPVAFTDITEGGNEGYIASDGWDAASGLGSPVGEALLAALGPVTTNPVPPTDPTPPADPPPAAPDPPSDPPVDPPVDPPGAVGTDEVDEALYRSVRRWMHHPAGHRMFHTARALRVWARDKGIEPTGR